jgi:hypothetical protein
LPMHGNLPEQFVFDAPAHLTPISSTGGRAITVVPAQ